MFITDVAGDVSLRLFCSLGFSRSVVDGLVASSGADRNGNYRPEPDTLLFLHSLLSYQLIQTITLCAPEEVWCGFEHEWMPSCRALHYMFYILQERWWRRTSIAQRKWWSLYSTSGRECLSGSTATCYHCRAPPLCMNTLNGRWLYITSPAEFCLSPIPDNSGTE